MNNPTDGALQAATQSARSEDVANAGIVDNVVLHVNGRPVAMQVAGHERLSSVLREQCGLTGTKIGCHAGDCGACTVLLDGEQVCACMVAVAQVGVQTVQTVEGLAGITDNASHPVGRRLQQAFGLAGAAQCGICTPGMLMAAADLLTHNARPDRRQVMDALGGVLCRCTGYQKIIDAVLLAASDAALEPPALAAGSAVGARMVRVDAASKTDGSAIFGADQAPENCLDLRVIRSPYPHATFAFGDLDAFVASTPGLAGFLVAADIPNNSFAIFPDMRDQPALADGTARFRGEAVLALAGDAATLASIDPQSVPITFDELPAQTTIVSSTAPGARAIQTRYPDNILCRGYVCRGDLAGEGTGGPATHCIAASMQTSHIEHAYIEPEAGWAQWHGADSQWDVTLFVSTQTPYLDRDEIAWMFGLEPQRVRIMPSAIGGGFGGKLDLSVQPLIVAAARKFGRPARAVFERPESMQFSTKRHPAVMKATLSADATGRFVSYEFQGDFNTGPYASWGPTVANRVPIHASGPYRYDAVKASTRAVLTNDAVCGAFRGFGVPQSTLLNETLIDQLAAELNIDPLTLRLQNAMQAGDQTPCGQTLAASVGLVQCLQALRPAWDKARQACAAFNQAAQAGNAAQPIGVATHGTHATDVINAVAAAEAQRMPTSVTDPHFLQPGTKRRGAGVACMWYGIGNTVMANPSEMKVGLRADGRLMLYNGAVDIGQGTYTIMPQMCADALGLPVSLFDQIYADTGLTADAGKSSASRQTFVSGNAARIAGEQLRAKFCALLDVPDDARLQLTPTELIAQQQGKTSKRLLSELPVDEHGDLLFGIGHFNPPTVPLDENGQGVPYATYGFAAQFAEVEVDLQLGTVRVLNIHAAHDVGRAINPTQVEGQIHGGIAQGLGLALMESYVSGRTDNLHDYLIPTCGDMPAITTYLIEDPEPLGPFGAKGVGEPALVATAPAILNAIANACGARLAQVPVTPDRLRQAIAELQTPIQPSQEIK